MKLISQVLITTKIEETVALLEAHRENERIVNIIKEDAFLVEDAKLAIEKAYMASEEVTVIVLAAKTFSPVVQNKLLKVIEEPPKNKEFIIITQSKAAILDTIRSRLPIKVLCEVKEKLLLELDLTQLSLEKVYEFIQLHKRTDTKAMKILIENISKEAIKSQKYNLDEKTLALFSKSFLALDMGSPPSFVLNALLLKLLARKKR
ncbi:MAG: DNA polymerase III subunit delta' [Epsilonproteobacteria bacterium]|nr:MAG: DNA polymerase III subunit delta' [Campylobacterota bacterium]